MLYEYKASPVSVHDGDTTTLHVDLGFNTWHEGPFRLARCNARELSEPGGPEAKDNLASILLARQYVLIRSVKPDKYGERYLCEIWLPDGTNLNEYLIQEQWAAQWDGRGTKVIPPWPRTVASYFNTSA